MFTLKEKTMYIYRFLLDIYGLESVYGKRQMTANSS